MNRVWKKYIPFLCGASGLLCLAAAVWAALELDVTGLQRWNEGGSGVFGPALGEPVQRLWVGLILVGLAALALLLLRLEGAGRRALLRMLLPVGAAILLRAVCLNYAGGDFNNFLSPWMEYFRANGGFAAIAGSVGDYNVPYLYFLAAISYLKLPDLYSIKLFSLFFDVLLAWGGFRLIRTLRGKREGDPAPMAAFALLLFLPTVILNGAFWAQCDVIYGALCVHALALVLEGKNVPSVILLAAAFSFKLQTVFLMPLWGALWLSGRVRFRELTVFPLAYLVTILPALRLGKPLKEILSVYLSQAGEYPRLSLNAPTVFQLLPYGTETQQAPGAAALGIAAAVVLCLILLGIGLWLGRRLDGSAAMAMAAVLVVGVPFLLPHMHERYFFLADVICLCWTCLDRRRIPAALLVQGASLASYCIYLRLKFNYILTVDGVQYVMPLETAAMFAALVFCAAALAAEIKRCRKKPLEGESSDETG